MRIAAGFFTFVVTLASLGHAANPLATSVAGALDGTRHRVIVTSDIGGTDPDDYQSMAHVLLYADVLEIEGLISSPFEQEGKPYILRVIDAYEPDYPNLRTYSDQYPDPDALRAMTKQGGAGGRPVHRASRDERRLRVDRALYPPG